MKICIMVTKKTIEIVQFERVVWSIKLSILGEVKPCCSNRDLCVTHQALCQRKCIVPYANIQHIRLLDYSNIPPPQHCDLECIHTKLKPLNPDSIFPLWAFKLLYPLEPVATVIVFSQNVKDLYPEFDVMNNNLKLKYLMSETLVEDTSEYIIVVIVNEEISFISNTFILRVEIYISICSF